MQEVFEHAARSTGETYPLDGDEVDLEPLVRDAVLLSLPLAPLCRPRLPGSRPDGHPVLVGGATRPSRRSTPAGPPSTT